MTPDELAAARAARRQALAEVQTLCEAVAARIFEGQVGKALTTICQAEQEFGGVGRWPNDDFSDNQNVEKTRGLLMQTETMLLAAITKQPRPLAPVEDVAAVLFETLKVLRTRDGLQVDELRMRDRAANAAMGLLAHFEVRLAPPQTSNAQPPTGNGGGPRSDE